MADEVTAQHVQRDPAPDRFMDDVTPENPAPGQASGTSARDAYDPSTPSDSSGRKLLSGRSARVSCQAVERVASVASRAVANGASSTAQ
jgi:hypothetical protein